MIHSLTFTCAAILFIYTLQTPPTYYVSPTGDDANSGSEQSPWKTLDKACSMAGPGTTIIVRGGTYPGNYCHGQAQGTVDKPITLKAYPSETPVFTGTHQYGVALNLFGAYWNVEDLTFSDTSLSTVINVAGAKEIHLTNIKTKNNNGGELIKVSRSSGVVIEKPVLDTTGIITDQGQGDCIAIRGSDRVLVENGSISRCGHSAVDVMNDNELMSGRVIIRRMVIDQHWGGGVYVIRGTANTLVEENVILHTGEQVNYPKACIQVAGQYGIYRRNICAFTGPNQAGYAMAAYFYAGIMQSPQHNRIYNETLYHVSYVPFQIVKKDRTDETGQVIERAIAEDNKIVNSILYYNKTQGPQEPYWKPGNNYITADSYQSSAPWDVLAKTQFVGNLILHADATGDKPNEPRMVYHQTKQVADLAWSLASAQQTFPWHDNRELNPQFINADAGDFRLASNSPAIDSGQNLTVATASGTSNILPVEDSGFFSDGWGMIAGDQVRVGSLTAGVISVESGRLILDRSITFTGGQGVNLAFNGNGPDIGAVESGGVASPLPSPSATLTPTPTPTATPTPTPTPTPAPVPTPTPVPTQPTCSMATNFPSANQWGSTKLVVTFIALDKPSVVTVTPTSGQVSVVPPSQATINGTSSIAEFLLSVKRKSSSVIVSGPCGSVTVPVTVR